MTAQTRFFSTISGGKIDRAAGIISGVSVITSGIAKGHGIKIDHKTLETVKEVASEFPSGVKVKFRHKTEGQFQSVIDEAGGMLKNFSIEGNKVRADFHLLKSLPADTKEKIFEMAEVMPDQFGFSIVFSGASEEKEGHKFARCQELQSIDLSDNPAANPDGLFELKSMKEAKYENGKDGKHSSDCDCAKCDTKKMDAQDLATAFESFLPKIVEAVVAKIGTAQPVTSLSFKNKDGKTIQLSAEDIQIGLEKANEVALEAKKNTDASLRKSILDKMDFEGRVPMNPATKKAFTLVELQALPIETLQFAAINSACIPLEAKSIFRGDTKPSDALMTKNSKGESVRRTGTDLMVQAWEADYGDLNKMLETPMGQSN